MLISSGSGHRQELTRIYFDSACEPKELWEVPETGHGRIYSVRPEEYEDKVCGFFNRFLVGLAEIEYT